MRTRRDQIKKSKQPWEARGKRKGNPHFKPVMRKGKDGVMRKVYIKRKR